jgi:hypothetical protein
MLQLLVMMISFIIVAATGGSRVPWTCRMVAAPNTPVEDQGGGQEISTSPIRLANRRNIGNANIAFPFPSACLREDPARTSHRSS